MLTLLLMVKGEKGLLSLWLVIRVVIYSWTVTAT